MASNEVIVKLTADISSLKTELGKVKGQLDGVEKNTSSATSKMKSAFLKVGGVVATAFAVGKVVSFGKECISMGAYVEEMENKFNVVFSNTGKEMDAWADTFSGAIGRSKTEIKTGVSNLGDLLTGYGMAEESAGDLSKKVVELSYDLASFNNVQDADAIDKMTKGILGEHEGLKSLGIAINDATIQAKMHEMGLEGQFAKLDEVTKAEVRYAIMLDQTKNAQGDAMRSADSYTNKQKALEAQLTTLKENIGKQLLPIMTELTDGMLNMVTTASPYIMGFVEMFIGGIQTLKDIVQPIIQELFGFIGSFIKETMDGSNGVLSDFQSVFGEVWGFCQQLWTDVGQPIFQLAKDNIKILVDFAKLMFPIIKDAFKVAWDMVKKIWDTIGKPCFDIIMSIVKRLQETFKEYMPKITALFKDVVSTIKKQWETNLKPCFDAIKKLIENVLKPAFEFVFDKIIKPLIKDTFGAIVDMWNKTLKPCFEGICDFINGVFTGNWKKAWEGIKSIFKGVFDGLENLAKRPINAIIGAVNGMIRGLNKIKLPEWVPGLGGKGINIPEIPKLATGGIAVKSTLANIGEAGTEAIVPLSNKSKMKPFAEAVASMMPDKGVGHSTSEGDGGVNISVGSLVVREDADVQKVAQELYRLQQRNNRKKGVVYA